MGTISSCQSEIRSGIAGHRLETVRFTESNKPRGPKIATIDEATR
jgi:hypothetical protein